MNNAATTEEFDSDCDNEIDMCEDDQDVPVDPKQEFTGLVAQIRLACATVDVSYERMISAASPFDKELVRRLQASQKADRELFEYVQSKVEAGQPLPQHVVGGLLGR